jgi:thioester reductase-like protein/1-acyl-sn-glycerol-3-phosphate acyltransferase
VAASLPSPARRLARRALQIDIAQQPPALAPQLLTKLAPLGTQDACYDGTTVILTGATGFLGKVVLEKILFSLRGVKKIYVLLRPRGDTPAHARLKKEVLSWQCFDRLREDRPDFESIMEVIAGDVSRPNLGAGDAELKKLQEETDWLINCAANVEFMEPLKKIVTDNVVSAMNVLAFAKTCTKLQGMVHVSTAYVNSNKRKEVDPGESGQVQEKIYQQWYHDNPQKLYEWILATDSDHIQSVLPELLCGMPNTYTFSKQMAEILLDKHRGDMSLAIVRPTCVGASFKEPMPGWIDKVGAGATLFLASGLGHLSILQGYPETVGDQIPVDMVTNVILTAVLRLKREPNTLQIYHSSSSTRNPITWGYARTITYKYFGTPGRMAQKAVGHRFTYIVPESTFRIAFFMNYRLPALLYQRFGQVVGLAATGKLAGKRPDESFPTITQNAAKTQYLVKRLRLLTQAFSPFVSNEFRFECASIDSLLPLMTPEDRQNFVIEVEEVDWEKYMYDFCWGLQRFILKEEVPPWEMKHTLSVPVHFGADLQFSLAGGPGSMVTPRFDLDPTAESILTAPPLQAVIQDAATATGQSVGKIENQVKSEFNAMAAKQKMSTIRLFAYVFPKIYRKIYDEILVDTRGVEKVREAVAKGPVIFLPTHRSYIDFLIISYITFANKLPSPHICAAEVFLKMGPITTLFRGAGAFFIKRSGAPGTSREAVTDKKAKDTTYRMLLETYVASIVRSSPMLEFFLEGTRSRSGKTQPPKYGMLGMVTQTVLQRQIPDAYIVPVTINYEKVLEIDKIVHELKGNAKKLESFGGAVTGGLKSLQQNFGSVKVCFGEAVSVQQTIADAKEAAAAAGNKSFDPSGDEDDRRALDRHLAFDVVGRLHSEIEISPTAMVSTLLLEAPSGLTWGRITHQVEWMSEQVRQRGGRLIHSRLCSAEAARKGVNLLGDHVSWDPESQKLRPRQVSTAGGDGTDAPIDRTSALMLGYYRNTLMHLFAAEAFGATVVSSFGETAAVEKGVSPSDAVFAERMESLRKAFKYEFVGLETADDAVVSVLKKHGVMQDASEDSGDAIKVASARSMLLLTAMLAPFIECYWFLATQLETLTADGGTKARDLIAAFFDMGSSNHGLLYYPCYSADMVNNALKCLGKSGEGYLVTDAGGKITVGEGKQEQLKAWAQSLEDMRRTIDLSSQVRTELS